MTDLHAAMAKDGKDYESGLHDQTQILPFRELLVVFFIMALSLCVCFIDQNSIGVLLPDIANDLHAQSTISWAGTSALIANTVFQVLYGRLSDLFGRKWVLVSALVLLSLSDLVCGLAPNSTVLYVFRGLAGIAGGGITSLTMMIVSDVVTLRQRGKYQGILGKCCLVLCRPCNSRQCLGVMVGLGNAIGPLIAASLAQHATWRGLFYLLAPLCLCVAAAGYKFLPNNMPKLHYKETIKKIDFFGLIFGTLAIILILIPVSEGGHGLAWSSPEIITMLTIGCICAILFIIAEWRWAKLPMMPLSMYNKPSVAIMLMQSFLLGAAYYTYLYYLPLYYENVHGYSVLTSALLLIPLFAAQSTFSVLSGNLISRINHYISIIWFGFGIWSIGTGLLLTCDKTTSKAMISGFLVLIGTGTGCVFQPTLVALQAHCPKAQRAVVTSNRNFLRSLGGAVSLAVSSGIMGNVLKASLPVHLQYVAKDTFAVPSLASFNAADRDAIESAYADASRAVFIWCVPLVGLCFVGCAFIKDRGLVRKEEKVAIEEAAVEQANNDADKEASPVDVRIESEIGSVHLEAMSSPTDTYCGDQNLSPAGDKSEDQGSDKDTDHSRKPSTSSGKSGP